MNHKYGTLYYHENVLFITNHNLYPKPKPYEKGLTNHWLDLKLNSMNFCLD
jgi:hypothetical protein